MNLGLIRSEYDCRDYRYRTLVKIDELPESLDLRHLLFGVKDQGSQGSCAAMTASQVKESQEVYECGLKEQLSPQKVYNLRENYPGEGMTMRDVMKILKNYGVCEERLFPYGKNTTSVPKELLYVGYKIDGYARIYEIDELKLALVDNKCCFLAVPVYNYTDRLWYRRTGDRLLGGHAMTIAGYNTVVGYNDQGFIIRNSWGRSWGDKGDTLLPYEDWDLVWEVWTVVDADNLPEPQPERVQFFQKMWNCIVRFFNKLRWMT